MAIHRKALGSKTTAIAENRQVRAIVSTPDPDRSGDIVVQGGVDLTAYRDNPVVLWGHDQSQPIAKCIEIGIDSGNLTALVQFPPDGDDPLADLIYNRIKNGVINATSIGFIGRDIGAVDPKNPPQYDADGNNLGGPAKFITCELAEFSFVSVPAVRGALVTERSVSVTIDAAELAALKKAAAAPAKLAADFRLLAKTAPKAVKGQILRLANMTEKASGAAAAKGAVKLTGKSLWQIGYLANALADIGWIHDCAQYEAEWEEDDSAVPAMLADALRQLGAALVAMTNEEVAEMLADLAIDEAVAEVIVGAEVVVEVDMAAPNLTIKDVIGALHGKPIAGLSAKAGRVLSGSNQTDLTSARDLIDGVLGQVATDDDTTKAAEAADLRAEQLRNLELKTIAGLIAA
ncbi:MAG: hypothetical protein JWO51_156 [Rhodospirillales bacterium]|nr:hypothetical protein [Rhodospirillales bacterium]